jgi:hypothetical protein
MNRRKGKAALGGGATPARDRSCRRRRRQRYLAATAITVDCEVAVADNGEAAFELGFHVLPLVSV